jgi:hypothetical protein
MRSPNISRFGKFNSRFGWANSGFAALREFSGKGLIRFIVSAAERRRSRKIGKIPGFDGKNREFGPHRQRPHRYFLTLE